MTESVLKNFPWDSDDQKKSVLAFVQWQSQVHRKYAMVGAAPPDTLWLFIAFHSQKAHEASLWWAETIGSQISMLQDEIKKLREELPDIPELARQVAHLTHVAGTLLPS